LPLSPRHADAERRCHFCHAFRRHFRFRHADRLFSARCALPFFFARRPLPPRYFRRRWLLSRDASLRHAAALPPPCHTPRVTLMLLLPLTYAFSDTLIACYFFYRLPFRHYFRHFAIASFAMPMLPLIRFSPVFFAAMPFRRCHAITPADAGAAADFQMPFSPSRRAAAAFVAFFSFDAAFILRLPPWRRYASLTS
jgi:hypothetical protein